MSLRARLSLALVFVSIFVGAVLFYILPSRFETAALNAMVDKGESNAALIARVAAPAIDFYEMDPSALNKVVAVAKEGENVVYVHIENASHTFLVGHNRAFKHPRFGIDTGAKPQHSLAADLLHVRMPIRRALEVAEDIQKPTAKTKTRHGQLLGWLEIGFSLAKVNASVAETRQILLSMIGLSSLASLLLALFLTAVSVGPLKELAKASQAVGEGDLSVRATVRGNDEVARTARTFNRMIEDLQETTVSVDFMEKMMNSMVDMVVILDLEEKVRTVNLAVSRTLGYPVSDLIGSRADILLRKAESLPELGTNLVRDGVLPEFEVELLTKDGQEIPVAINASAVVNASGETEAFVIVAHDIRTSREMMESLTSANRELQLAMAEAEGANRAKSQFLANMSHEIRTPMNGVIGMTELLSGTTLDNDQRDFCDTIGTCGQNLLTLINDILDFSKMEAGHLELEGGNFDLFSVVEDVIQLLAKSARKKDIMISSTIERSLPSRLNGDAGRLRQILTNLVGNAIKFTEHGEVVVEVKAVERNDDDAVIRFDVRDTGIGMSAEACDRVFSRFSQADESMTRRFGGTGLGLTISKQLAELMGGDIGVESEMGQGSNFWFSVRLGTASTTAPEIAQTQPEELRGLPLFIVEANENYRQSMAAQLERWDFRVAWAENEAEALKTLSTAVKEGDAFRVVFVADVQEGPTDGFELTQKIQEAFPETLVVLVAGAPARGDAKRAREAGAAAYLSRPIRQSTLFDAIVGLLARPAPKEGEAPLITRHSLQEECRDHGGAPILVVEDNAVNQRVVLRLLQKLGYNVDVRDNGKDAITAVEERHYQAILMDCQMPIMDGIESTIAIRKLAPPETHLPIIALSAEDSPKARERCLSAGMDDFLTKPVDLDLLNTRLAHWIGNSNAP
jgi:two-component system, sensor histidine kinase and response regulator